MKKRVLICLATVIAMLCLLMPSASANTLAIERQIFTFVTEEMGLNSAAACGILANIEAESSFNLSTVGDKGTSFGLCQWHNTRYDDLKSFCLMRGYDYRSLEGQMNFMAYELKTTYQGVYAALRNVPNTADGAYTAAYHWCYYYERPADLEGASVRRGRNAQFKYWLRYGGTDSDSFTSSGYSGAIYDSYTPHSFYWDDADSYDDQPEAPSAQPPVFTDPDLPIVDEQVLPQQPETQQDVENRFQYVPHHMPTTHSSSGSPEMGLAGCFFITAAPIHKRQWVSSVRGEELPEDWDGVVQGGEEQLDPAGESLDRLTEIACGA